MASLKADKQADLKPVSIPARSIQLGGERLRHDRLS